MFDNTINLFNVQLPQLEVKNNALVLSGCNSNISTDKKIYSELDELNFICLNSNNGYGYIEIELCFDNNLKNPYIPVFGRCFTIRTNNGVLIKLNGPLYDRVERYFSKVSRENKFVIGICYFFSSEEEKESIIKCNYFCIEGFIALRKKRQVYGVMCRLNRIENDWKMIDANTSRISKYNHINSLYH